MRKKKLHRETKQEREIVHMRKLNIVRVQRDMKVILNEIKLEKKM